MVLRPTSKFCLVVLLIAASWAGVILPDGFKLEEFASVPGARSMAMATDGTLFVSVPNHLSPKPSDEFLA